MNKSLILVSCGLLICFLCEVLSKPSQLQIKNGEDAEDGEFPYMVEVRAEGDCFLCGGTIIAPRWILTAGHCIHFDFDEFTENYTIVYGTKSLYDCSTDNEDPDTVIKAKNVFKHPDYEMNFTTGTPLFDVGLIELEEDIPFGPYAQPILLAEEDDDCPIRKLGNLSGWGSSDANGPLINTLQKIQLTVLENQECSALIDYKDGGVVEFNGTQYICTDNPNDGQCSGDSGSPYVINGIQYAIVSWAIKPCGDFPGVLTRVSLPAHRQWIRNITGV